MTTSAASTTEATTKTDEGLGAVVPQWDEPSLGCHRQKHGPNPGLLRA